MRLPFVWIVNYPDFQSTFADVPNANIIKQKLRSAIAGASIEDIERIGSYWVLYDQEGFAEFQFIKVEGHQYLFKFITTSK